MRGAWWGEGGGNRRGALPAPRDAVAHIPTRGGGPPECRPPAPCLARDTVAPLGSIGTRHEGRVTFFRHYRQRGPVQALQMRLQG